MEVIDFWWYFIKRTWTTPTKVEYQTSINKLYFEFLHMLLYEMKMV
jgi:hypothetical protein